MPSGPAPVASDAAKHARDRRPSILCRRGGRTPHPGSGDFYIVKIKAVADPTPPRLEEPGGDVCGEIERLISEHILAIGPLRRPYYPWPPPGSCVRDN